MLRRTLLVLPTTLGLLLTLALPAAAQSCDPTPTKPWHRHRRPLPQAEPCDVPVAVPVGRVTVDHGTCGPRAPRAWQPAPARVVVVPADQVPAWQPAPVVVVPMGPAPATPPRQVCATTGVVLPTCEPVATTTPCPPAWRPTQPATPQPARYIPREWRSALSHDQLLDAYQRLRAAAGARARGLVVAEVARQSLVTVDQVVTLAGALPPAERLEALVALHAATIDPSNYGRTYGLLSHDDQWTLYVRVTRPMDARTAAQNQRLERLRHDERQLQRAFGD